MKNIVTKLKAARSTMEQHGFQRACIWLEKEEADKLMNVVMEYYALKCLVRSNEDERL